MPRKRLVFSALVGLLTVYAAYPYFTLYRLANAVSNGDPAALSSLISWDLVREGIKEDICDAVTEAPASETTKAGTLPPFGYSFVRGVAANAVDTSITPEALVTATRSPRTVTGNTGAMTLNWAFFDSPGQFTVAVGMPGQDGADGELRLLMEFRHGSWMVTRAWLPASMMMASNNRT
jgi:hypothetical protein